MTISLEQIWTVAGILLGFQVTAFAWRITREAEVGDTNDITWLPPADYLNLLSMVLTVAGVFVLPLLGIGGIGIARLAFGLASILLVGYSFALAGHYELFDPNNERSLPRKYCPKQEQAVLMIVVVVVIAYIWVASR